MVGSILITTQILVAKDGWCPAELLIGADLMKKINKSHDISINLQKKEIKIGDYVRLPIIAAVETQQSPIKVHLCETEVLQPRSDNFLWGYITRSFPKTKSFITKEANHNYQALKIGRSVVTPGLMKKIPIRILNAGNASLKVFAHSHVADLEETEYEPPEFQKLEDTLIRLPKKVNRRPSTMIKFDGSILTNQGRECLKQIVDNHSNACVLDDGIIGKYKGPINHRIDLEEDATPFKLRPYRIPFNVRQEVERQINEMLKQHIIVKSQSPFASPIVLVPKKNNTYRFAVDYRKLNSMTKKSVYLLPLINDVFDTMAGNRIYSNFDLASGFHQIPMEASHAERTAFITHIGLFHFTRMPFGLISAPSTFQSVMDEVIRDLGPNCMVYLDDVIIGSENELTHLQQIEDFLFKFEENGLKLNLEKCVFGRSEIKYLGFVLSKEGISPDKRNIETVQQFGKPKTLTELRSLCGALSYFRRFIPNFSLLMQPIYALTKKENLSDWNEQHDHVLYRMKKLLTEAPVLAPPNFGKSFEIETDASKVAIAAVLLQRDANNQLHPISYNSRMLSKHEQNYHAIELESLAIIFALKTYAPYITGSGTTIIRTDSSVACSLLKNQSSETNRLLKFKIALQAYDVKLVHRAGKSNHLCDYMSRYLEEKPVESKILVIQVEENKVSHEEIRMEQRKVKELKIIIGKMKKSKTPIIQLNNKRYVLEEGILCLQTKTSTPKIIVPYSI